MTAASIPPPPPDSGAIEALKRVKTAETEWDEKLSTTRSAVEADLARRRDEADAAVKAALAESERERATAVQTARTEADAAAATILADGQKAAQSAGRSDGKEPEDRKDEILKAVLAPFVGD